MRFSTVLQVEDDLFLLLIPLNAFERGDEGDLTSQMYLFHGEGGYDVQAGRS